MKTTKNKIKSQIEFRNKIQKELNNAVTYAEKEAVKKKYANFFRNQNEAKQMSNIANLILEKKTLEAKENLIKVLNSKALDAIEEMKKCSYKEEECDCEDPENCECDDEESDEEESDEEGEESDVSEAVIKRKNVVRKGKVIRNFKDCPPGFKKVGNRCVKIPLGRLMKMKRKAKIAARKRKVKASRSKLKRKMANRKRRAAGL